MTRQQYILHLSSRDSGAICSNTQSDFTVDLGKTLHLPGQWRVQLLSFRCHLAPKDEDSDEKPCKNLYVFSDLCESSFVQDQYLPVLGNFYWNKNNDQKRTVEEIVQHPYSLAVVPHQLQRIRVYIRNEKMTLPSFADQRSEVTLRLYKKD